MKDNYSLKLIYSVLVLFFISTISLIGQSSQIRENAPNIFIDCEGCDMDHIRTEINFVNFVTETKESDIHIIIITQTTGSRGQFYTLQFIGQREFSGKRDTLDFNSSPDDTYSIRRDKLVNYIKLGLIDYIKTSPLAEYIKVSFTPPAFEKDYNLDKWRNWVFRIGIDGQAQGQVSYRNYTLNLGFSADKVTPDFKTGSTLTYGFSEVDLRPNRDYHDKAAGTEFSNTTVFSINDHWSWGIKSRAFNSKYMYSDLMIGISPAIEYNIFPYSQATTRQIAFNYSIGPQYWDYVYKTFLYEVQKDLLWQQRIELASELVHTWGRFRFSAFYYHYLRDLTLYNLSLASSISLRIVKGLEFNFYGSYSFMNDQHYLPKVGPSDIDIILRRRQLPTSYNFRVSIGFSYRFGNIYSNVVNPRFGY